MVDWKKLDRLHEAAIDPFFKGVDKQEREAEFRRLATHQFPAILVERQAMPRKLEAVQVDGGDSISDQIQGMLQSGSKCILCARTNMHTHTPEEIIIYRNGVKYGSRNARGGAMICPQSQFKVECNCNESGQICKPLKPTMAEIERLLEAYYAARYEHEHGAGSYLQTTDYADATAALLAAIRSLSNSTQQSE